MRRISNIIRLVSIFGLGAAFGFVTANQVPIATKLTPGNTPSVMKALTRLSETKIPQNGLHCEVNGTLTTIDGITFNNDVLVGDFIAHYLSWSFLQKSADTPSLMCEGKDIQQCTWAFGESKSEEGWNRILRFKYNQASSAVDPQSLECIDVP